MASTMRSRPPGFPEAIGEFRQLAPVHFRAIVRRAQGFTAKQIADEFQISPRTVDKYLERSKIRLGRQTIQDVIWTFYQIYAPNMWPEPKAIASAPNRLRTEETTSQETSLATSAGKVARPTYVDRRDRSMTSRS